MTGSRLQALAKSAWGPEVQVGGQAVIPLNWGNGRAGLQSAAAFDHLSRVVQELVARMTGRLQWQSAFCQKFLKTVTASKRVESRFNRENHHRSIQFRISRLQIVQGRVFLFEGHVNDS